MTRAVQCYKQRGWSVQNIDVQCVHGSWSVSVVAIKAVLHNSSSSSLSISTTIGSSNQINSQSSVSFPAQFVSVVWVDNIQINCELRQQLFVPNRKKKKNMHWKYNTGVECDIGSVLHKEGSPPCNVNTAVNVCCHVWLLPFYLKHIEYFPPHSNYKTNCELFLELYVQTTIWRTADINTWGLQLFSLGLLIVSVDYISLINSLVHIIL